MATWRRETALRTCLAQAHAVKEAGNGSHVVLIGVARGTTFPMMPRGGGGRWGSRVSPPVGQSVTGGGVHHSNESQIKSVLF